jgi:hypothetical protein
VITGNDATEDALVSLESTDREASPNPEVSEKNRKAPDESMP